MERKLPVSRDITRITIAVLFIGMLIAASFWVMKPFLSSLIWATMIVVSTWPLMLRVQAWLKGKRSLAVVAMTLTLLLVFVLPFSFAVGSIVNNADEIHGWVKSLSKLTLQPPPEWVEKLPLVGKKISTTWREIASSGPEELSVRLAPYAKKIVEWFVAQAGSAVMMFVQFLLTVILSAVLYSKGETAAGGIRSFALKLAGKQGEDAAILAGRAIRSVALGIVVTALIQSALGGIGLTVAGIPAPALLTGVLFLLCVAQLGPYLVLLPSVVWLYWMGDTVWGTVLLVWTIFVGTIDNFLRPVLIRKGADLPLLLIFAGVIGGLIAFGIVGLFIGPVVLAVSYTLLSAWVESGEEDHYGT